MPQDPTKPVTPNEEMMTLEEFEEQARQRFGIPKKLWKAIPAQESGGDWSATSPTKVRGKYQMTQSTAKSLGLNRDDPYEQAAAAAKYLRQNYDRLEGVYADENDRWYGAAAMYYGGPGAVLPDGSLSTKSLDQLSTPKRYVEQLSDKIRRMTDEEEYAVKSRAVDARNLAIDLEKDKIAAQEAYAKGDKQAGDAALLRSNQAATRLQQDYRDLAEAGATQPTAQDSRQWPYVKLASGEQLIRQEQQPAAPVQQPGATRTWGQAAKDVGLAFGASVVEIPGMVVGLASPDLGAKLSQPADALRAMQSDILKQKREATNQIITQAQETDGFWSAVGTAVKEYGSDPALLADFVASNLATSLPGMGIGKGVQALARGRMLARGLSAVDAATKAEKAGAFSAKLGNAILNAGGARADAYKTLTEDYIAQGMSPEDAANKAAWTSLGPTGLAAIGGYASGDLGIESRLFGKAARSAKLSNKIGEALTEAGEDLAGNSPGLLRRVGRGAAAFAAEQTGELLEEVPPQIATNVISPRRGTLQEVPQTIAQTLVGAAPTSGVAGLMAGMERPPRDEPPAVPDPAAATAASPIPPTWKSIFAGRDLGDSEAQYAQALDDLDNAANAADPTAFDKASGTVQSLRDQLTGAANPTSPRLTQMQAMLGQLKDPDQINSLQELIKEETERVRQTLPAPLAPEEFDVEREDFAKQYGLDPTKPLAPQVATKRAASGGASPAGPAPAGGPAAPSPTAPAAPAAPAAQPAGPDDPLSQTEYDEIVRDMQATGKVSGSKLATKYKRNPERIQEALRKMADEGLVTPGPNGKGWRVQPAPAAPPAAGTPAAPAAAETPAPSTPATTAAGGAPAEATPTTNPDTPLTDAEYDEMVNEVRMSGKVSVTNLQKKFGRYASHIRNAIDQMERQGVVTPTQNKAGWRVNPTQAAAAEAARGVAGPEPDEIAPPPRKGAFPPNAQSRILNPGDEVLIGDRREPRSSRQKGRIIRTVPPLPGQQLFARSYVVELESGQQVIVPSNRLQPTDPEIEKADYGPPLEPTSAPPPPPPPPPRSTQQPAGTSSTTPTPTPTPTSTPTPTEPAAPKRNWKLNDEVSVDGKNGEVRGTPFGKVLVVFTDGTRQVVDPDQVQPPVAKPPEGTSTVGAAPQGETTQSTLPSAEEFEALMNERLQALEEAEGAAPPPTTGRKVEFGGQTHTLTPEQAAAWDKADQDYENYMRHAGQFSSDPEMQGKLEKAAGMRRAATRREILNLPTAKEKAAQDKREAGNYIGKKVSVDGVNGEVTGTPFGKVTVRFVDGTTRTVDAERIQPPVDTPPGGTGASGGGASAASRPTVSEAAQQAAVDVDDAVRKLGTAIREILKTATPKPGSLSMAAGGVPINFDPEAYRQLKPYLEEAFSAVLQAGSSVAKVADALIANLRDKVGLSLAEIKAAMPYIMFYYRTEMLGEKLELPSPPTSQPAPSGGKDYRNWRELRQTETDPEEIRARQEFNKNRRRVEHDEDEKGARGYLSHLSYQTERRNPDNPNDSRPPALGEHPQLREALDLGPMPPYRLGENQPVNPEWRQGIKDSTNAIADELFGDKRLSQAEPYTFEQAWDKLVELIEEIGQEVSPTLKLAWDRTTEGYFTQAKKVAAFFNDPRYKEIFRDLYESAEAKTLTTGQLASSKAALIELALEKGLFKNWATEHFKKLAARVERINKGIESADGETDRTGVEGDSERDSRGDGDVTPTPTPPPPTDEPPTAGRIQKASQADENMWKEISKTGRKSGGTDAIREKYGEKGSWAILVSQKIDDILAEADERQTIIKECL